MIEIEPTGSFFEVDNEGYIVNPTSLEKIQDEWRPLIDDVISAYKEQYGEKLKNVYIRGSVAKGEAVSGVSDIDTFAFLDFTQEQIKHDWVNEKEQELLKKYPFTTAIEFGAEPLSHNDDAILLNQSLCVFGTPLTIRKIKPGKEAMVHAPNLNKRVEWFNKFLDRDESVEEIKKGCVWLMKGLLRVGCEIVMERSGKYTRDLYPCYQVFSEYYPEKEPEMRQVLHYALNPSANKEDIKRIMSGIGVWLLEESKRYI